METPMGKIRFDRNQSLYQVAYVGQLDRTGQYRILWQSREPIKPEPYDPLVFPGRTCQLH
jgi:urea transport system substrate-binding protein